MTIIDIRKTIEALWRMESAKVIAVLARMLRDVSQAEELAQDVLVTALEQWPQKGVPDNPAAWLMAAAKRRAIDRLRHQQIVQRKHEELGHGIDPGDGIERAADADATLQDDIGDDLLRLVFVACHPFLSPEARVALTLRLLGGLATEEIARAFLVPESTIAQRIVRAKRTLAERQVRFEVPRADELGERLGSVLEVVYLVFNEGYAATAGEHWTRPDLCEDALRLGRVLAGLMPKQAEVHGLVALMEIQASRLRARTGADGEPVLLLRQDRAHWDHGLIRRGMAALARAERLGEPGTYTLQAAIAACHARAPTAEQTDWPRIVALYEQLARVSPSPVVELNRAVAVSMASGAEAGLAIVDALRGARALANYHLLPGVRGDLLEKLGRRAEARAEFQRAAGLARNARERELMLGRASACVSPD